MKTIYFLVGLFFIYYLCSFPVCAEDKSLPDSTDSEDGWVMMPAGAKPAYMGIHGGTMPISLLVSRDGTSLFSFVGLTGNDFLEALRKVSPPSFSNSTRKNYWGLLSASGRAELFAGNATATMAVNSLSGDILSNVLFNGQLQPFGLSTEPLSIEGEVTVPDSLTRAKHYRVFSLSDYFKPVR